MTQKQWVLHKLQNGRRITRLDAFKEKGIGRLSARINELKNEGHPIEKEMVKVTKWSGETTKVAEYYLTEPASVR